MSYEEDGRREGPLRSSRKGSNKRTIKEKKKKREKQNKNFKF